MTQSQLSRGFFPWADIPNPRCALWPRGSNLPNKTAVTVSGVCFLGQIKFRDFVLFHLGRRPGPIVRFLPAARWAGTRVLVLHPWASVRGLAFPAGRGSSSARMSSETRFFVSAQKTARTGIKRIFRSRFQLDFRSAPEKARLEVKIRHGRAALRVRS